MQLTKLLEGTAVIENNELAGYTDTREINLEYYMLEVDGYNPEIDQQRVYGIQIVKTEVDRTNKINTETQLIPDISTNKESVKSILQKLIVHKVTPIALYNVLEDIIGVYN